MRIPKSTYRLQQNSTFRFKDTQEILPYLNDLGVSDIYLSPILQAGKGSTHGYDVVDHHHLNQEIGQIEDLENLSEAAKEKDMGIVVDIVPNHMSFSSDNPMIIDLLENGPESKYYHYFDVDWNHPFENINGKLLVPFLGRFLGECIKNGELQIQYDSEGFSVNYYSMKIYVKIESYHSFLTHHIHRIRKMLGKDHPSYIKLLGILYTIRSLSLMNLDEEMIRSDQIRFIKNALWELHHTSPEIKGFIQENLDMVNQKCKPELIPDGTKLLTQILNDQYFRLSFWKVATQEINFRRFFTINNLISLRVGDEEVFKDSHKLLFELHDKGLIHGFRIDHIDGLYDPEEYLARLSSRTGNAYVLVEKILELKESLPKTWNCSGTTGYDFLNFMNGLFVQTSNEKSFDTFYEGLSLEDQKYYDLVLEKKAAILKQHMSGDIDNIARLLQKVTYKDQIASDYTFSGIKQALQEVIILFPVYRTYIRRLNLELTATDKKVVRSTLAKARSKNPELIYELNFLEKVLLLDFENYLSQEDKEEWLHFVMKFQQFTGPLMAKGLEDTAFYIYSRFISLNEVGGDPANFGITLDDFHQFQKRRAKNYPHTMNNSSTHDTKRGEDVRARLNVLSEIPVEWRSRVKQWFTANKGLRSRIDRKMYPTRTDEYFIFQTIYGTFPPKKNFKLETKEWAEYSTRIQDYTIKAFREAKIHTNWLKPNQDYENAVLKYVKGLLNPTNQNFLKSFTEFMMKTAPFGVLNSLSQVIVKSTCPGVPDFYQGTDFWDYTLVDPDNRRPVNYPKRQKNLKTLMASFAKKGKALWTELLANVFEDHGEDPSIKQFLTHRVLKIRRDYSSALEYGNYESAKITGKRKLQLISYTRTVAETTLLVLVPRFVTKSVTENKNQFGETYWEDTRIHWTGTPPIQVKNLLTEEIFQWPENGQISAFLSTLPFGVFLFIHS